jgi:hypothetical protein
MTPWRSSISGVSLRFTVRWIRRSSHSGPGGYRALATYFLGLHRLDARAGGGSGAHVTVTSPFTKDCAGSAKLSTAPSSDARLGVKMAGVSGQWSHEMERLILAFVACLTLAACGLGETAVSAAANGSSQAEQAKQALKTEARVKQQLDAAASVDAEHRQAADTSSQ